jgi:hypothetical protein
MRRVPGSLEKRKGEEDAIFYETKYGCRLPYFVTIESDIVFGKKSSLYNRVT